MKKTLKIIIIVVILCLFTTPSLAKEPEEYIEEFDDIIPEEAGGLDYEEMLDTIGVGAFINEIFSLITGSGSRVLEFLLLLVGGLILIACSSFGEGRLSDPCASCVSLIVLLAVVPVTLRAFEEASSGMKSLSEFFALFIPIASGITVSSGATGLAAASAVGMNVTLSLVSGILTPFFLALASFSLAVGMISSVSDGVVLNLSSSIKSFFMWAIGLVCASIMGAMALQSFIAASRDSTVMRAAKYAAQSMIPIVGGTVSGALSTLATGLVYAKNIVGAGAVTVIVSVFLSPLIMLLLYRLAVSFVTGLAGYLGLTRAVKVFSSLRGAFDIYVAVYAVSLILYVFEIMLFMMCEVGTV